MKHILVKSFVGENAITFDDGEVIFREIHSPLKGGETIQLDFAGVTVFASPFFNAAIGRLLSDLSPADLNRSVKFEHLSGSGSHALRRVIENAKEYYATTAEQRRRIDQVVTDSFAVA